MVVGGGALCFVHCNLHLQHAEHIQLASSSRRLGPVFINSPRIDLTVGPSAAPHLIFCQRFGGLPPGKHLTFGSRLP